MLREQREVQPLKCVFYGDVYWFAVSLKPQYALVMELVDVGVSNTPVERRAGSNPALGTIGAII